ncbi:MAG: CHAT domain-containing protein, partial [Bacteroidota bacterium]
NTNISELRGSSLVDNLGELPGSTKELDNISKLWPGLTFKGQDATEAAFRKHAPSAGIIHLATHSLVDHNNPMNSVIVFSENNQNEEDGLLHTYELLNMKLNASLVTLSACNTGVGKYYEGEGMISLATGFNMAGVDNIVMSLWPVPDQTTSVIMTSFYSYLQKGKEVSEALRQAKLDFISSQDENLKHPYYWAGFVVSSDKWNTGEADRSWIWLLLIVFPVAVVLTIWKKIR